MSGIAGLRGIRCGHMCLVRVGARWFGWRRSSGYIRLGGAGGLPIIGLERRTVMAEAKHKCPIHGLECRGAKKDSAECCGTAVGTGITHNEPMTFGDKFTLDMRGSGNA